MFRDNHGTLWKVVYEDYHRHVLVLERARRFFKGQYKVVTWEQIVKEGWTELP